MTEETAESSAMASNQPETAQAPEQVAVHRSLLTADRTENAQATRHVMLPVDDTDDSELAINWAIANAYRQGDIFHLVHVIHEPTLIHVWGSIYVPPDSDAELREIEDTKDMVTHRFAEALVSARIPFKLHVIVGPVDSDSIAKVVLTKSADVDAALIVIARHQRGRFSSFFVGSVTSNLVKKSKFPVVVVPRPGSP